MMKKIFYLAVVFGLFLSCEKDDVQQEVLPEFTEFIVEKELNENILTEDIVGKIENNTILLDLPKKIETEMLTVSFKTTAKEVTVDGKVQISGKTKMKFDKIVAYKLASNFGVSKTYFVVAKKQTAVPHIYITTEDNQPITSKEDYVKTVIKIDGNGIFEDYEGKGKIKGRGNTTWAKPKKPYKIKLKKKESLLGMLPEKDWVLLANYIDPTLMLNATAMKIGRQLDIDYANHIIPIDVTINGVYRGQYNLTEKIEVKKNRVDVEDGVLLEFDAYYDEDFQFKTAKNQLPVMFKYPKKVDNALFEQTKQEINHLEELVMAESFPDNNYLDYFDKEAFVKYMIVCLLTDNEEINHPKSTYMNKKSGGKYRMGPIWDFDWAYGFEGHSSHFTTYSQPFFWKSKKPGTLFFERIMSDPKIAKMIKEEWTKYRTTHFQELLSYLDAYYYNQKQSRAKDYELWKTGSGNFDKEYNKLREWLENRATFLDEYIGKM